MAGATNTKRDRRLDGIILETQGELKNLREELDKYKTLFDSARLIVGHEFIKPLTSIGGYLELLEGDLGGRIGEGEKRYFSKIAEAVRRLEDLIEAFVQMLRFDSRAEEISDMEYVDIRQLVEKVAERFGGRAENIESSVESDLPPLLVKRKSLEVVLENIISNALKYGGGSPVSVRVTLEKERRGVSKNSFLLVQVEDRGSGMPEDKLDDIFNPFYKIGGRKDAPGLGLGLALVKSVITIMKGEINIKSKMGEGTTVTVTVPIPIDSKAPIR